MQWLSDKTEKVLSLLFHTAFYHTILPKGSVLPKKEQHVTGGRVYKEIYHLTY